MFRGLPERTQTRDMINYDATDTGNAFSRTRLAAHWANTTEVEAPEDYDRTEGGSNVVACLWQAIPRRCSAEC